ncbi:MAG TPA: ABC transporter permease [Candidatus Avipropionibacterium avicola]|uniref:ABC transporter permease n=1 Tax=Candidatus Avipropionibacterium avicola TaxID=2840701 RepID=A0A9D1GWS8_9ACTN|nr:ABC transporter permease [Candidatus Avipropionibacterium avicola]
MLRFTLNRLVRAVITLAMVSLLTFTLLQLAPGNFADLSAITSGATMTAQGQRDEVISGFTSRYGAEIPVWQQYLIFMKGAVTWDMGPSYKYPALTVEEIIGNAFPVSASIAILAVLLALAVAVPIGVVAARRRNGWLDNLLMFLVTIGNSVPNYLMGAFLLIVLVGGLHLLPSGGWDSPVNMIMPVIALAIGPMAVLARYVRSAVIETLREEYVTTAIAKGGPGRTIMVRHVLRNSLIPVVTVVGPIVASLMAGTVFIETMFRIPGLGQYFTGAATSRDMPLLMGTTLFFAALLIITNVVVDVSYGFLDPRTRVERQKA